MPTSAPVSPLVWAKETSMRKEADPADPAATGIGASVAAPLRTMSKISPCQSRDRAVDPEPGTRDYSGQGRPGAQGIPCRWGGVQVADRLVHR